MNARKRVTIIIQDAGNGHRATGNAIHDEVQKRELPWDISIVNVQREVLHDTGGENLYNFLIRHKLDFLFWPLFAPLIRLYVKLRYSWGKKRLRPFWKKENPQVVLSLMTFINRALHDSLKEVLPEVPYITVMLDLIDRPPHFWIENIEQTVMAPTEKAVRQAVELGGSQTKVISTSGVILHPRFYDESPIDCDDELLKRGLSPGKATFFIMFGGVGSPIMLDILQELNRVDATFQVICVCGRNEKLKSDVEAMELSFPIFASGFTTEIPLLMKISDIYIGKPGPGSISEAIQMNMPVITFDLFNTLHHERYNLEWLKENNFGIVVKRAQEIKNAAERLLSEEQSQSYVSSVKKYNNNGLFELCDHLEDLLEFCE